MSRSFILSNGQQSVKYWFDERNFLRDWKNHYPCPVCLCQFLTAHDVCCHVKAWHRETGMYYGKRKPWSESLNPRIFGDEEPPELLRKPLVEMMT